MGIARTFQNIRLFSNMSVIDNVKVGLHNNIRQSFFASIFRGPAYYKSERAANNRALELLDVFNMADLASSKAGSSPTARSAGWKSHARWPRIRALFSWTSRPPA